MPTNINGNTGIDKVQDGTVVSADIATLDASKLTGSIAAARIANNTIDSAHIASGAVDDAHLATGITASKLTGALPAISAASLTNVPKDVTVGGRKNMVINGAMQVAQRGTSSTSGGYATVDRFFTYIESCEQLAVTQTQSTDNPNGFGSSYKLDVTTAETATEANDQYEIVTRLEGQDLQHLQHNSSGAKSVTLSFWVRSSKTGTYCVALYKRDTTRNITSTYAISSANTWEKKTVTFAGDTSGAIDNDANRSLDISWKLLIGSNFTGTASTTWGSTTDARSANGHTATWGSSTSDDFYLTGVQLELGSTATDFEHRSYGEELVLCQRYYQILVDGGADKAVGTGFYWSSNEVDMHHRFDGEMRAAPTLDHVVGTDYYRMSSSADSFNGFSGIQYTTTRSCNMYISAYVSGTAGYTSDIRSRNADSFIAFTAEL